MFVVLKSHSSDGDQLRRVCRKKRRRQNKPSFGKLTFRNWVEEEKLAGGWRRSLQNDRKEPSEFGFLNPTEESVSRRRGWVHIKKGKEPCHGLLMKGQVRTVHRKCDGIRSFGGCCGTDKVFQWSCVDETWPEVNGR